MNSVNLMGRLTADPELKTVGDGISVCSFSVAVRRDADHTSFFDIQAWRKTAEFICKYFRKGQMIAVSGSLDTQEWKDQNGNNRRKTLVVAQHAYFCGGKSDTDGAVSAPTQARTPAPVPPLPTPPPQAYSQGSFSDFQELDNEDDLPF